jgi:hypothetical protein
MARKKYSEFEVDPNDTAKKMIEAKIGLDMQTTFETMDKFITKFKNIKSLNKTTNSGF